MIAMTVDDRRLMTIFRTLPDKVARKVGRAAVNAGATPVLKAAKGEVPVGLTGNLRKSLGKKTKYYRRSGSSVAMVGPRIGGGHLGYHGHLIEDGHVNRDGSFTPGNPWLKRATSQTEQAARAAIKSKLAQGIVQEATR